MEQIHTKTRFSKSFVPEPKPFIGYHRTHLLEQDKGSDGQEDNIDAKIPVIILHVVSCFRRERIWGIDGISTGGNVHEPRNRGQFRGDLSFPARVPDHNKNQYNSSGNQDEWRSQNPGSARSFRAAGQKGTRCLQDTTGVFSRLKR